MKIRSRIYKIIGLIAIFSVALIIRLYPVINSPEKFRNGIGPYGDTFLYHSIAYNLYKGNGFSGTADESTYGLGKKSENLKYEPAIARGPAYPFFIYLVYKFLGNQEDMKSIQNWHNNWDKVRMVQCVLDASICLLVFFIVRNICPLTVWPAFISSVIYCFSFYNIFYTRALLSESLTTFLLSLTILFCVVALKAKMKYWWFFTGIGLGLVILSRAEYILFPCVLAVLIYFVNRQLFSCAAKKLIFFFIGVILVVAPWSLRNYLVSKKPIIVCTGTLGWNLYVGTFASDKNWIAYDKFPDEAFVDKQEKDFSESLAKHLLFYMNKGNIKTKEINDTFISLALSRISQNPWRCFKVWLARIPGLWYQNHTKTLLNKQASGNFFIFYFIFALYAFLTGKIGERILMVPVWLVFIYLTIILLPLFVVHRYGVALMPGIISLSGIGVWKFVLNAGRRN